MSVWESCHGKEQIGFLGETTWRIVESQEISSTRKLVNTLDEQILLEHMIDEVKPPITKELQRYHPLLYTPFRYPPLKHGSRFGNRHEPSLWYGSLQLRTAMAELAYYRLNFLRASDASYGVVVAQYTAFSVQIETDYAIKLTHEPFSKFSDSISSPVDYSVSQAIGNSMRESGVQAFSFRSARDPELGVNIGLFTPAAFAKKQPDRHSFQSWQCVADHRVVEFLRTSAIETSSVMFSIESFLVDGELPFPGM